MWLQAQHHENIGRNHLLELMDKFPDAPWHYSDISRNPNFNMTVLTMFFNDVNSHKWDWYCISKNKNITWDIVKDNNLPWDWCGLSLNPNITIDIIQNNNKTIGNKRGARRCKWQMAYFIRNINANPNLIHNYVTKHKTRHIQDIISNPNISWDELPPNMTNGQMTQFVTQNKYSTWDKVIPLVGNLSQVDWHSLSKHPMITWNIITTNLRFIDNLQYSPKCWWRWDEISKHPNITWDIIKNTMNIPSYLWNWNSISQNPNVTLKIILDNPWHHATTPNIHWSLNHIVQNPNMTADDIMWIITNSTTDIANKHLWLKRTTIEYLAPFISHNEFNQDALVNKKILTRFDKRSTIYAGLMWFDFPHDIARLMTEYC